MITSKTKIVYPFKNCLFLCVAEFIKKGWRETMAVGDFYCKQILNLPNMKTTLDIVGNQDTKRYKESLEYILSLGFNLANILEYKKQENCIYYNTKNITNKFSNYEFETLKIFLLNPNKIVTFDNIAKHMYGDKADEKFSMWGITKNIQRVRNKLEEIGLTKKIITNVKGKGFKIMI